MASEAEDAEALTREVAMYDQEEDAIDAFMGSASSFTAAEPEPMRFDTRDERDAESSLEPTSAAAAAQSDASNRGQDPRYPASSDNRGNSSTPMAFNPAENSDAAFGFEFPSMSSNQSSEFFGEQAGTASSSSERHLPASQRQQDHQQSQQREDKAEQESEDFNQLMAASADDTHQDARSSTRLKTREQEQQQQHQQQEGRYAESRPDEQYREAEPLEMPMDTAHNSAMRDPASKFSYSPPHQQQQNPIPEPASTTHDTQTAASPRQPQQHDSSAPTMPSNSSEPSISSSSTSAIAVGSKRAAPPSPAAAPTGSAPVAGSAQSFSWNDILRVQNMIERCLQQYLSKPEILQALQEQAQVDPEFTSVVWQKLEEQNPSFFRAYNVQLQLKEQILAFNYLVTQQKEMMATKGDRSALNSALSALPPLQVDSRSFMRQGPSTSASGQQMGAPPPYLSGPPAKGSSNQFSMPPPSPLPLPSPIKTDLDTHAFFT